MDKKHINHLLVKISKGDNNAFEELYVQTSKGIYALLYPYFKNSYDTEDAVEDVFIRVKQKAHLYKNGTDGRAWLFQLAKNFALNKLRSKKREAEGLEEYGQIQYTPTVDKASETRVFLLMQQTLDELEYEIVIKHVIFLYKHKDIAKELDMPLGTVLTKYNNAIKKLRKELDYE